MVLERKILAKNNEGSGHLFCHNGSYGILTHDFRDTGAKPLFLSLHNGFKIDHIQVK